RAPWCPAPGPRSTGARSARGGTPAAAPAAGSSRRRGRRAHGRAAPRSFPPPRARRAPSPSLGELLLDIARHHLRGRPVMLLGKMGGALGGLEVELDRVRAGAEDRFLHEAGGGIDVARGADREEQLASTERIRDAVHLERHLAEPDDVRAHAAAARAARALGFERKILLPGMHAGAELAARLEHLAMHVDEVR